MRAAPHAIFLVFLTFATSAKATDELFDLTLEELLSVKVESTSFFEETLFSTNYSVTPTSQEQWRKLGVRNLGELMNRMPSTIAPLGFGQSRVMAIRGYLDTNPNTGTAVRLDGVPLNKIREGGGLMALDGLDLALLQSTELIRGPGSSLHGNDAFHGVLSLETLNPDAISPGTRVPESAVVHGTVEAGSHDYQAASVSGHHQFGNHSIIAGVAYRNIGDAHQGFSYVDNDTGELKPGSRSNARESGNLLMKYQYENGDLLLDSAFYAMTFDAEQLPGAGQLVWGNQQDEDFSNYQDSMQLLRAGGEYQVSDSRSVEFMAYYWRYRDHFSVDLTRIAPLGYENSSEREEGHLGFQLHQLHRFSDNSHLTYGYEYMNASLDDFIMSTQFPDQQPSYQRQDETGYKRELHSLLVDGRQQLTDGGLALTYGLRLDHYSDFDAQMTPRLGLSQFIGEHQVVHLTYGEGFRAPALFENLGGGQAEPNPDLQPERLKSLELKYSLERDFVFYGITLFANKWDDAIQVELFPQPMNGYFGIFDNTGRSTSRGIEYEMKLRWQQWETDFSLSYIKDRNDETGDDYNGFPPWISDINIGYRVNNRWAFYCNNRYMENPRRAQAEENYLRTDLVTRWDHPVGLSVDLVVRNLLNRNNAMQFSDGRPGGLEAEPLNVSAAIRYQF